MKRGIAIILIILSLIVILLLSFISALTCTPGPFNKTHFCNIQGEFEELREDYQECLNNYECLHGSCIYGKKTKCTGEAGCSEWNKDRISCEEAGCTWSIDTEPSHYCEPKYKEIKEQTNILQAFFERIVAFFSGIFNNIATLFRTAVSYEISRITDLNAVYNSVQDEVTLTWCGVSVTQITGSVISPLTSQIIRSQGITGEFTLIEGECGIASTVSECEGEGGKVVMKMSGPTNAHGELESEENYDYNLCCRLEGNTQCTGDNIIVNLSSATNAHAEIPTPVVSNYNVSVCFTDLECITTVLTCPKEYTIEMISLSDYTNAHIGAFDDYTYGICCNFVGIVDIDKYIIYRSPVSAMDSLGEAVPSEEIGYESISEQTPAELGCGDGICEFIDDNLPNIDGIYYYIVSPVLGDNINYSNEANVNVGVPLTIDLTINFEEPTTPAGDNFQNYIEVNVSAIDNIEIDTITIQVSNDTDTFIVRSQAPPGSMFFYSFTNFTNLAYGNYELNTNVNNTLEEEVSTETREIRLYSTKIPLSVSIIYPKSKTYRGYVTELNYIVLGTNIDSCWWSDDNGITNYSITECQNLTGLQPVEGNNIWTIYANNTEGEKVSDKVSFELLLENGLGDRIGPGKSDDVGTLTTTGVRRLMHKTSRLNFKIDDKLHSAIIKEITSNSVTLEITSNPIEVTLSSGQTKDVNIDQEGAEDLRITLEGIIGGAADLIFRRISVDLPEDGEEPECTADTDCSAEEVCSEGVCVEEDEEEGVELKIFLIVLIVLIIAVLFTILLIYLGKKRKQGPTLRKPGFRPGMPPRGPPHPPRKMPPVRQPPRRQGPSIPPRKPFR